MKFSRRSWQPFMTALTWRCWVESTGRMKKRSFLSFSLPGVTMLSLHARMSHEEVNGPKCDAPKLFRRAIRPQLRLERVSPPQIVVPRADDSRNVLDKRRWVVLGSGMQAKGELERCG